MLLNKLQLREPNYTLLSINRAYVLYGELDSGRSPRDLESRVKMLQEALAARQTLAASQKLVGPPDRRLTRRAYTAQTLRLSVNEQTDAVIDYLRYFHASRVYGYSPSWRASTCNFTESPDSETPISASRCHGAIPRRDVLFAPRRPPMSTRHWEASRKSKRRYDAARHGLMGARAHFCVTEGEFIRFTRDDRSRWRIRE